MNNISIIYKNISIFIENAQKCTAFQKKLIPSLGETSDPKTQLHQNVAKTSEKFIREKQRTNTSNNVNYKYSKPKIF